MLVLSRKEDDKILFPNLGITVQILRVDGSKVRVGVDAPQDVKILRHELADNVQAARSSRRRSFAGHDAHLRGAAQALSDLYDLNGREIDTKSEKLIFDVFHHLKAIDEQLASAFQMKRYDNERQGPGDSAQQPRRRALLVEDNLNESRLLAGYLKMKQFDVSLAMDGTEALDYLETNESPDVVLLDMHMPNMDGATTIRRVRANERHRDLKVFAVSGGNPDDYGVDVGPAGVDGWFPKPLDPEALIFRLAFETDNLSNPRLARGTA